MHYDEINNKDSDIKLEKNSLLGISKKFAITELLLQSKTLL